MAHKSRKAQKELRETKSGKKQFIMEVGKKSVFRLSKLRNIGPFEKKMKTLTRKTQREGNGITLPMSSALMRTNSFLLCEPATSLPLVSMNRSLSLSVQLTEAESIERERKIVHRKSHKRHTQQGKREMCVLFWFAT